MRIERPALHMAGLFVCRRMGHATRIGQQSCRIVSRAKQRVRKGETFYARCFSGARIDLGAATGVNPAETVSRTMSGGLPPVAQPQAKPAPSRQLRVAARAPCRSPRGGLLSGEPGQKARPNAEGGSGPQGPEDPKRREPPATTGRAISGRRTPAPPRAPATGPSRNTGCQRHRPAAQTPRARGRGAQRSRSSPPLPECRL